MARSRAAIVASVNGAGGRDRRAVDAQRTTTSGSACTLRARSK
jgi:hypothetical protein